MRIYVKSLVYVDKPETIETFEVNITRVIRKEILQMESTSKPETCQLGREIESLFIY